MLDSIILDYMRDKALKYSVHIKELKNNQEWGINVGQVVPSASVIKLFIMAKAYDDITQGKLKAEERAAINSEDKVPFSIISVLDEKNTYTIKDLITLMIIQSDNTATNVLIDILGMENINKYIVEAGFNNTLLRRKMMDFRARAAGRDNYTTALEVSKLLELMYRGQLINKGSSDSMLEIMKMQLDNSLMRSSLEEELIIAHKTGGLPSIKHDAGIVYTANKDYIFTMLTWDALSDGFARGIVGAVSRIVYDYLIPGR